MAKESLPPGNRSPSQVRWINVTEDEAAAHRQLSRRTAQGRAKSRIYRILRSGEVRINSKAGRGKQRVTRRSHPHSASARGRARRALPAPHFRLPVLSRTSAARGGQARRHRRPCGSACARRDRIAARHAARRRFLELVHRLDPRPRACSCSEEARGLTELHRMLRDRAIEQALPRRGRRTFPQRAPARAARAHAAQELRSKRVSVSDEAGGRDRVPAARARERFSLLEAELLTAAPTDPRPPRAPRHPVLATASTAISRSTRAAQARC